MEFLKKVSRKYPSEILKEFNIDINSKEIFKPLLDLIEYNLKELEKLTEE